MCCVITFVIIYARLDPGAYMLSWFRWLRTGCDRMLTHKVPKLSSMKLSTSLVYQVPSNSQQIQNYNDKCRGQLRKNWIYLMQMTWCTYTLNIKCSLDDANVSMMQM